MARPASTALIVAILATLAGPAPAALDPKTNRQVGGIFSNACDDTAALRIRLYDDVLDVQRAGLTVKASKLQSVRTPPPGPPVAHFAASVRGRTAVGTDVMLTITHNAQGLFARIDGAEDALSPMGPGIVGQVLRHCDPNRNALPGAPTPPTSRGPDYLLEQPPFRAAYTKALGPLARERWISRMDGPAPTLREVALGGARWWLAAVCKPHDCADHNLIVLWDEASGRVIGLVHQKGRQTLLGDPPPAVAKELQALWAKEWRQR